MTTSRAAQFAATYALLRAAADVGDHWVQSDVCAQAKGATDDRPVITVDEETDTKTTHGTVAGRRACLSHCLTYTATQGLALAAGSRVLGLRLKPAAVVAALAVSGATHYAADRRIPGGLLERLAARSGKGRFYRLAAGGLCGSYLLDQAWHHGWETVAALIAASK